MNLSIVKKISKYLTLETAIVYYNSFIMSRVTYGMLIWGGTLLASAYHSSMEKLHEQIIKCLFHNYVQNDSVDIICRKLKLFKLHDIYKYKLCLLMHKILYKNEIPFVYENIVDRYRVHVYNTRQNNRLELPFPTTDVVKFNFLYRAVEQWNRLPDHLRENEPVKQFKAKLKDHFIYQYNA